jgi:membrane peptidoglycan carboxypeptidase
MAIGQVLTVAAAVVDFTAAWNGGTLYRPQLVQSIRHGEEAPVFSFAPEVRGMLPLSAENLAVIQDGMRRVTNAPGGTARATFYGWPAVAGKTGTAQDLPRAPHAWFTGFTFLDRSDNRTSLLPLSWNIGEGSRSPRLSSAASWKSAMVRRRRAIVESISAVTVTRFRSPRPGGWIRLSRGDGRGSSAAVFLWRGHASHLRACAPLPAPRNPGRLAHLWRAVYHPHHGCPP